MRCKHCSTYGEISYETQHAARLRRVLSASAGFTPLESLDLVFAVWKSKKVTCEWAQMFLRELPGMEIRVPELEVRIVGHRKVECEKRCPGVGMGVADVSLCWGRRR